MISNAEWDDGNSFGSTFSNLFSFLPALDIANIYCRNGVPRTKSCGHFLSMGESHVARFLFKKVDFPVFDTSHVAQEREKAGDLASGSGKMSRFARKHRWLVLFWLRELLWGLSGWKKSKSLHSFVDSFHPDLLFLPTYSYSYINKVALYLADSYGLPIISYASDDEYSYNPYRWSPFYRIDKLYQRKWIKRGIDRSHILYVISDIQCKEYTEYFGNKCKVLTKGASFKEKPEELTVREPIKILYIGNIGTGRWQTLSLLSKEIASYNNGTESFRLDIYTGSSCSKEMKESLSYSGTVLHGFISPSAIPAIIQKADVLLHVESFNKKEAFAVHQSFSTKIVDFMSYGKCLLAIGPQDVASIFFLKSNDVALTATASEEIRDLLIQMQNSHGLLNEYAMKAWETGKKSFDIDVIHNMLLQDFENVIFRAGSANIN